MIDVHCHIEQKDYDNNREKLIEKWKKELRAIITSCAHINDFEKTIEIVKKHKNFIFATFGLHPEFEEHFDKEIIEEFKQKVRKNIEFVKGIGEIGLDYYWIKEEEKRRRQKELFIEMLGFAKELKKPIVVHSRDAVEDTIAILEKKGWQNKKVLMHMFNSKQELTRVIKNGWYVSIGPLILTSKTIRKIARDAPLTNIMLETDSPWIGKPLGLERNEPTSIKAVAEKIAEIKKISFKEVWTQAGRNAIKFFNLELDI